MDQLKEFLRQCVKYRFWISLGVAALFAVIAYFLGSGPVKAAADQKTKTITSSATNVKAFSAPGIPNEQYKPIVEEKTEILTKDVNSAWRQLYSRQAPLLTWPERVQKRFREWGRAWPEKVAEGAVELAKVDYIEAYPEYVDTVYKTFKPFDPETGKGVVSAPPKEALLRPVAFDTNKLPELGDIWAAQERLWLQRTALEVVAQVNKNAKDWDSAIIKQINLLEVGNSTAQDQRSIAKNESLEPGPSIVAPGTPEPSADTASTGGAGMESMMRGRMGMGGSGGMMGGGGASEGIYFVKPENDRGQYKILPILMSVLVDQDHIQDLLVELENSPMSIQVMEPELQRPSTRVTKPEKGEMGSFSGMGDAMMGGMMRGMGGMMGARGGRGMMGYGGMASNYSSMMSSMMGRSMQGGMYESMMKGGGMGGAAATRKGTDKRSTDRAKTRGEEKKSAEASKGPSLFDPYFNIVEVKVYGQARFYNPPPEEPAAEPSPGETASTPAATEPVKAESVPKEPAGEPAKAEPAKTEPAKTEPAKTEPAKAEAAKTSPAKAEPATTEPGKAEPAKAAPDKADEPKKDSVKP